MDLSILLKPAIALAENGFYTPYQLYRAVEMYKEELSEFVSWRKVFGKIEREGYIKFEKLAMILKRIARHGRDGFYSGEIAEKIVEGLNREGSPISIEDFERHRGFQFKPIKLYYGDSTIYELPPNTQGITTLEILALIKELGLDESEKDAKWWDKYMKATALAYYDRDRYIGDPDYMNINPEKLIERRYIESLSRNIELNNGDTTFFTLSDKYGNIMGFIQSIFYPFGSGIVSQDIVFQSRLIGFKYEYGYPNSPAPEKRPLHTLSISLIDVDEDFYIVGCAGGDLRPQIHSQVISNILVHGMDIASATISRRGMLTKW
jgi:gamma-glutamyltranspeptidase/glutathione hydrolase